MARPAKRRISADERAGKAAGKATDKSEGRTADKGAEAKGASSRRVTPKGGGRPEASTRYTPPVPRQQKVSPLWVPVLMFVLLGLGGLVILLNYVGLLPGATSNWYLLVGLGFILGGIITATNFH